MFQIDALHEHAVLVQRDQRAQRVGRELRARIVLLGRLPSNVAMRHAAPSGVPSALHLLRGLAECERFGLREHIRHQQVVLVAPSGFSGWQKPMKSHGTRRVPWWIN